MSRFWLTLDHGVKFVIRCAEQMCGGEVFVPKIPSMNIVDLAHAVAPECEIQHTGIRPGEKLHEQLLSADEARQSIEYKDMYVIKPAHSWWYEGHWDGGSAVEEGFSYLSNTNPDLLSVEQLQELVQNGQSL
jgi:UDP-N-acetylglucosamine 4,6-dehydratase/5-epimerase